MPRNAKVTAAVSSWANSVVGGPPETAVKRALTLRYIKEGKSTDSIAREIYPYCLTNKPINTSTIRYHLKRFGIEAKKDESVRGRVVDKILAKGYSSVEDFFLKNSSATLASMAKDLGVSLSSIQRYYRLVLSKNRA